MQICSKDLPPWHFYSSARVPSHLLSALTPPLAMMAFILSTCRVLKNASLSHFSYFRPTLACPWKSHSVILILTTQSGHCALNISIFFSQCPSPFLGTKYLVVSKTWVLGLLLIGPDNSEGFWRYFGSTLMFSQGKTSQEKVMGSTDWFISDVVQVFSLVFFCGWLG